MCNTRSINAKRRHRTAIACRKVPENARATGSGASGSTKTRYQALLLYKKRTTPAEPYAIRPAGTFAHLIHSQAHNIRGQLSQPKPRHMGVTTQSTGLSLLDLGHWICTEILAVWPVGQFTVRNTRECARSRGLSNGCTQSYPQPRTPPDLYKKPDREALTNALEIPPETAGQNLITALQPPPHKAPSQVHPTYSQPVPQ